MSISVWIFILLLKFCRELLQDMVAMFCFVLADSQEFLLQSVSMGSTVVGILFPGVVDGFILLTSFSSLRMFLC